MTDALEVALANQPVQTEQRLVTAMRGIGSRIVQKPEIVRAMAAAESLTGGLVITSPEKAAEVADLTAQVIEGERCLKAAMGEALRIPRQMENAVKQATSAAATRLTSARLVGNESRVAWQASERRRVQREEEARRVAAEQAAQQATAEAGEEVPVAEVAHVEPPRTVAGGIGKQGTMVRVDPGEIVTLADVPPEWLLLATAVARAVFLSDEVQGKVKRAAPGKSIVYRGVRFNSVEHATNRR